MISVPIPVILYFAVLLVQSTIVYLTGRYMNRVVTVTLKELRELRAHVDDLRRHSAESRTSSPSTN